MKSKTSRLALGLTFVALSSSFSYALDIPAPSGGYSDPYSPTDGLTFGSAYFGGATCFIAPNIDGGLTYGASEHSFYGGIRLNGPNGSFTSLFASDTNGGGDLDLYVSEGIHTYWLTLEIPGYEPHLRLGWTPAAAIEFGSGMTPPDTVLARSFSGVLQINGQTIVTQNNLANYVTLTGSQTLTGKTLSSATLSGTTIMGGASTAQQVRVDASGSVGIGTPGTPGAKLSVVDSSSTEVGVHVQNTATNGYSAIRLGTDSVTSSGTALHDFGSGYGGSGAYGPDQTTLTAFRPNGLSLQANANAPVKFFTGGNAASNERMRIDGTGNVGIGTAQATLSEKLQVAGGNVLIKDSAGTGGWIKGVDDNHSIYFREGGTDRINYYEYGGLLSQGKGHRFYTGGAKSSQSLRLQIADDLTNFTGNVSVQGSLAMEGLESRTIMARGGAYAVGPRKVLFKGVESVPTAYGALSVRGLAVMVIDRTTLTVDSHINYDCFAVDAERTAMASALNALGSDKFVVITSTDAWSANASLKTALLRVGASPVALDAVNQSPYALIGIPGIGAGNGLEAYNEVINGTPLAGVTTFFVRPTAETSGQFDIAGRKDNTFVKNDGSVYFNTPVAISGSLTVNGSPVVASSGGSFTGGVTVTNDNTATGGLTLGSGTLPDGANLRLVSSSTPQWNLDNYYGSLRFFSETAPNSAGVVAATISSDKSFNLNDGAFKIIGSGSPQYTGTLEMVGGGDEVLKIYGAPRISLDPWGSNVPHGKVNITSGGLAINTSTSASTNIINASAALQIEASTSASGGIWLGGAKLYTPTANQFNLEMQQPLFQVVSDGMAGPKDAIISGRGSGSGANSGEFQLIAGQAANADGAAFHTKVGGVRTMSQTTQTVSIVPATSSTSTTTGALVVAGGAGIAGNMNVGGNLTVSGSGTLTVPSITLPDGAISSSKTKTLYDASGTAVATVDGSGKVNFINGLSVGTNPAATLTPNSTAYLNQTAKSLGFTETPVAPTAVLNFGLSGNITVLDVSSNGSFSYVAGVLTGTCKIGDFNVYGQNGMFTAFVAKLPQSGGTANGWVSTLNGQNNISLGKIGVDSSGNVFAAGLFQGAITVAGVNLQPAGYYGGLVVKFNSSGAAQWGKAINTVGSSNGSLVSALAVSSTGDLVLGGTFGGTITNLAGTSGMNLTSAGEVDGWIAKMNSSGTVLWAKQVGNSSSDAIYSVALDGSGNVIVGSIVTGTINNLAGTSGINVTAAGGVDALVFKMNSSGVVQWARPVGNAGTERMRYVTVDSSGNNIVVGSSFSGTINNLGGTAGVTVVSAGAQDGLVAKFNASGVVQWARSIGNANSDNEYVVALDSGGNVFATGDFSGTLIHGGQTVVGQGQDVLLVKYLPDGTLAGLQRVGGPGYEYMRGLAITGSGFTLWGYMDNSAAWAIGDAVVVAPESGNYAVFIPSFSVTTPSGLAASLAWGAGTAKNQGVALGSNAYATAASSAALGSGSATASYAFSAGSGRASGGSSTAMGQATLANGSSATAMGDNSVASGDSATAFGTYTRASGSASLAAGSNVVASGWGATAIGVDGTTASGDVSVAFGEGARASGYTSVAMGSYVSAQGSFSTAMGYSTYTSGFATTTVGSINVAQGDPDTWIPTDDLFVIGNGNPNEWTASNALTVHKNGNTRVAGTVEAKGGFRTPPMGDIDMGEFTAGRNPLPLPDDGTGLDAGLRYPGE